LLESLDEFDFRKIKKYFSSSKGQIAKGSEGRAHLLVYSTVCSRKCKQVVQFPVKDIS
jgi:hypothetical protein